MVRGNPSYGINDFTDNNDGTITDKATGLMWQKGDDGIARDWEQALDYAGNLSLAGYTDWRLPNAKELQSIVDYSRCPDYTGSPAINPLFQSTMINDPNGNRGHYPYYWTGTTHLDGANPGAAAVYIAFGKALGKVNGILLDVHGAGAQRSDPKSGNPSDYPQFMGPQGDARIVYNYVRCVRNVSSATSVKESNVLPKNFQLYQNYPNPFNPSTTIKYSIPSVETPYMASLQHVTLKIFDLLGREVCTLVDEYKSPGNYSVQFNAGNYNLSSGIYFCRINSALFSSTIKLTLTK